MIELLDSVFIIFNKIFAAVIISDTFNDVTYTITLGQFLVVCILIGVVLKLFLPRAE